MDFGNPGARQQYYDRNPTSIQQVYLATVGPHASTQRWSYTVPANRKFIAYSAICSIVRETAAAPVGDVTAQIYQNATTARLALARQNNNTVGTVSQSQNSNGGVFLAGEVLTGNSSDLGTGGTNEILVSLIGTEYDA